MCVLCACNSVRVGMGSALTDRDAVALRKSVCLLILCVCVCLCLYKGGK